MSNEEFDTTNKLIKPEDIPTSDNEVVKQLSDNLQNITPKDIDTMCNEIDEAETKMKEEEEKKKKEEEEMKRKEEEERMSKIPEELKSFRETWEKEINLDDDMKRKIIEAVKKIPHTASIESDGSGLVEFELGGKKYQCLDVNLTEHSDIKYLNPYKCDWQTKYEVMLVGMMGDDTSERKNRKLAEYVERQKYHRKMEIPTVEFQRDLLNKLGEQAGLTEMKDKIAMWMYLTGNYGYYWLTMGNSRNSNSQSNSRSELRCNDCYLRFDDDDDIKYDASLCLIACEGEDGVTPKTRTKNDMIDFFSRVNNDSDSYY